LMVRAARDGGLGFFENVVGHESKTPTISIVMPGACRASTS
jgi:hypothetical protein